MLRLPHPTQRPPDHTHDRLTFPKNFKRITLLTATKSKRSKELNTGDFVDKAPPELQLSLDEDIVRGLSRQSTIHEDKIGISFISEVRDLRSRNERTLEETIMQSPAETSKEKPATEQHPKINNGPVNGIKIAIKTASSIERSKTNRTQTPAQNSSRLNTPAVNANRTPRTPRSNITPSRALSTPTQTPRTPRTPRPKPVAAVSVKSLNPKKTNYIKHVARAHAVFKDKNVVYRRKITLTGKIKKRKQTSSAKTIKLKEVTRDTIESSATRKPKQTKDAFSFDLIKEMRPPPRPIKVRKPKVSDDEKSLECERTVKADSNSNNLEKDNHEHHSVSNVQVINVKEAVDDNFFVCSAEEDNPYAELVEMRRKERQQQASLFIHPSNTFPTSVPVVPRRNSVVRKEKNAHPLKKLSDMLKRVQEVAKTSALRNKKRKQEKEKAKSEQNVEEQVLSKLKFQSNKIIEAGRRRRRDSRPPQISRDMSRLPTLVEWVECSDILSTPAMKKQQSLSNQQGKYDSVKNTRFR